MLFNPLALIAVYLRRSTPRRLYVPVTGLYLSLIKRFLSMGVDFFRKTDYIQKTQ